MSGTDQPDEPRPDAPAAPAPGALCGYPVVERLSDDGAESATYLATGPGGRGVVLKPLGGDCLHRGQLHPGIRDRLERVRELAHPGVANLHGVGREGDSAWLIWEHVEGQTFEAYAKGHCESPRSLAVLARELVLTVDALHARGIVHGAVSDGNAIVTPAGSIRLTHVSPYLYTDPADDAEAVLDVLEQALSACGLARWRLHQLVEEARATRMPLRTLATRLAALIDSRDVDARSTVASSDNGEGRRGRRRMVVAALLVAGAGAAVAYGVWYAAGSPAVGLPTWIKVWERGGKGQAG